MERCGALHALVLGTDDGGEFYILSSYGGCKTQLSDLNLNGIDSIRDLRTAVMKTFGDRNQGFSAFPLISNAGLFGALGVLYGESQPFQTEDWTLIEALAELTAISLSKTFQQQKLQKMYDDLRVAQDILVRTEKIRALGMMSAGIAHDLKNLLNPLFLYVDEIRETAGNREEVLDTLKSVDRVLNRGLETVERLRDFSRLSPEESETTATDLDAMVREAIEICRARLNGTELVLQLGSPPFVLLRAADCVTAIVNLVFNAIDAVGGKGRVTIRTDGSESGSWIEVADNGAGMSPEVQSRIIEPFFTTKGNQGTGLGVSTVFAFAQRQNGRLEIESAPGAGARFRMWFPAIQKEVTITPE